MTRLPRGRIKPGAMGLSKPIQQEHDQRAEDARPSVQSVAEFREADYHQRHALVRARSLIRDGRGKPERVLSLIERALDWPKVVDA